MNDKNVRLKNLALVLWAVVSMIFLFYTFAPGYLGHIGLPLLKALLLAGGIFVQGFFCLQCFNRNQRDISLPVAFAVGLMFTTTYFFLASFLKLLVVPVIVLYYVLPVPMLLYLLKKHRPALSQTIVSFFHRSPLEYPVFFLPFIFALLPASFYDTLVYHLGIPNLYLLHGGFIQTSQFMYANTSIYYEIALIPAVFAGETVPCLLHFFIGVIFILAAGDFAVEFFAIKKRGLFILLVVSMPMSVFLLSTVKNDLLSAFFILLGIQFWLHRRTPLTGLFWGFAIGIKYFNILPIAIFLVVYFIKERKIPVQQVMLCGFMMMVVVFPLFLKNYLYTGNPFFPFLGNIFTSPYWDDTRTAVMVADVGKMFHSMKEALAFPYTISFHHSGFGGMVGVQFLMFLPFLLLIKERWRPHWHFLLFAVLTIYISGNVTGSVRFLYLAFVMLAIFLVVVYESMESKIIRALFCFVIAFNVMTSLVLQEQMFPSAGLLSGSMGAEEYKDAMFPTYAAIAYVNQHVPMGARILVVGEARNYYLQRPYFVSSALDYGILKKYLASTATVTQFIDLLQQDQMDYIMINLSELNRLQNTYHNLEPSELNRLMVYFKEMQPRIVFQNQASFVLRIKGVDALAR